MGAGKIKVGNIYFNIWTCKVGYAINIHPSMLMYSEFKIIVLFMQFQKFSFFFYDYVIVHQGAVVYISRKPMICASTKPWHIVFFSQNCTSLVLRFKVKVKKLNILKILFLSFSFLLVSLVHLWWLSWMGKYGLVLVWAISIIFFIIIILNSNDGNVTVGVVFQSYEYHS